MFSLPRRFCGSHSLSPWCQFQPKIAHILQSKIAHIRGGRATAEPRSPVDVPSTRSRRASVVVPPGAQQILVLPHAEAVAADVDDVAVVHRPIRDTRVPRPTRCRRSRTRRFPGTAATPRRCRTGLRDIGHRHARSGPRRCRHDHPETTARRSRQRLRLPPGVALRAGRRPLRPRPPHRGRLLAPQAVAGRAHQAARVLLRRRGLRLLRHEQPVFAALARFRHSWYSRWHLAMFPHRGSRLVMPRRFWRGSARQC